MKKVAPAPDWLIEPELNGRRFNGEDLFGYNGEVLLQNIDYWVSNRRTERQLSFLTSIHFDAPSSEEVFTFLETDPELEIEALAKNIIRNGLRERIVLDYHGRLLDGNRRYLAHRWIEQYGTPDEKKRTSKLACWVLGKEHSDDDYYVTRVITEYNFLTDFRLEWSYFVKAKLLYEQHDENVSYDRLNELYGGPGLGTSKIREMVKTYELIMLYAASSPDEEEALNTAAQKYIWFEQLQRSYRTQIREDEEFQEVVFDNIRKDRITKTPDLKNLTDMRNNVDAWALFKKGEIEAAHLVRQKAELQKRTAIRPHMLMAEANNSLRTLLEEHLVEQVAEDALTRFHELARRVPGQVEDVNQRITYVVDILQNLTSPELATLSQDLIDALEAVLLRVIRQSRSTRGE